MNNSKRLYAIKQLAYKEQNLKDIKELIEIARSTFESKLLELEKEYFAQQDSLSKENIKNEMDGLFKQYKSFLKNIEEYLENNYKKTDLNY